MGDVFTFEYTSGTQLTDSSVAWTDPSNAFDGTAETYADVQVGKYASTTQNSRYLRCDGFDAPIDSTSFGGGTPIIERVQVRTHYYNEYVGLTDAGAVPVANYIASPTVVGSELRGGASSTMWETADFFDGDEYAAIVGIIGSSYSHWFRASNFGFNIPTGSTIRGIAVSITVAGEYEVIVYPPLFAYLPTTLTSAVQLVGAAGTPIGSQKDGGNDDYWGYVSQESGATGSSAFTYGGNGDMWGTSLTAANINDPDFGFVVSAYNVDSSQRIAGIYHVEVTVYYEAEPTDDFLKTSELFAHLYASYNGGSSYPDNLNQDLYNFVPATPGNPGYFDVDVTNWANAPSTWQIADLNTFTPAMRIEKGERDYTIWDTFIDRFELVVTVRFNYGFIVYDENGDEVMNTEDGITRIFYDGYSPPANINVGRASTYQVRSYAYPTSEYSGAPTLNVEVTQGATSATANITINSNQINTNVSLSSSSAGLTLVGSTGYSASTGSYNDPRDVIFNEYPENSNFYKIQVIGIGK